MNKLSRLRVANKYIQLYKCIRYLLTINNSKLYYSAQIQQQHEEDDKERPHRLDVLLQFIPEPWDYKQRITETSPHTESFKDWCNNRKLTEEDGIYLSKLKQHLLNGGHPDFPRITKNSETNEKTQYHMTEHYYTSIDKLCFKWIKKQKRKYQNRTIHPWIQWKLEQLNVTLDW